MLNYYKNNIGLLATFTLIFAIPWNFTKFLQKYFDEQISYGNCGTGVWILLLALFIIPIVCMIMGIFFTFWVGRNRIDSNKRYFWIGTLVTFVAGFLLLPVFGVTIIAWVVVGLVVSMPKLILYLLLPLSLFFPFKGYVFNTHNIRALSHERAAQSRIELMGFLTRHYTERQGVFSPDDSEWVDHFYSFLDENGLEHWMLPIPSEVFQRHNLNRELIGLLPEQIDSDAVFVFEKPFDSDCVAGDPDTIKVTEKKFIRVVTYDGKLFRYIPKDDQYIPVKMRLLDRWSVVSRLEPNDLD